MNNKLYFDSSINDELAISLVVMTALILLVAMALVIFAAVALYYVSVR